MLVDDTYLTRTTAIIVEDAPVPGMTGYYVPARSCCNGLGNILIQASLQKIARYFLLLFSEAVGDLLAIYTFSVDEKWYGTGKKHAGFSKKMPSLYYYFI